MSGETIGKIRETKEIPLDQIEAETLDENLEGLVDHINKWDLLKPVVVCEVEDEKYELIHGRRRYMAIKKFDWMKVPALVLGPIDPTARAKIASLIESNHIRELPHRDMVDSCDELFNKYGSLKAVAEELGVSEATVKTYLSR